MSDHPSPLAAFSHQLAALARLGAARTVAVHGRDGRARSGLLWAEGLVVTAEEALERDDELALTLPDGRQVPATLAGRDPGTDGALLRAATGPVDPLPLAPPGSLAPGHLLLAIGRAEHGPLVAFGLAAQVGGPWRSMRGGRLERRIQLGLRLDPAAEGGVVLDHEGRLLGMAVPGPRRHALAIPAETIARSVEQLATRGRIARGYLGLALQPVRTEALRGLIVVGADPLSPAGKAGILLGDVLTAWDDAPLTSVREMLARLDHDSIGVDVTLDLVRGGRPLRLAVRIGGKGRRLMSLAALLDRRPAATAPGLGVLVRSTDPALAARLARLPGIRLVEDAAEAAVQLTDQPAGGGPPSLVLPSLVLAEGTAALAALRAGARAILPPDATPAELAAALAAVARGLAVVPPGLLAGLLGTLREAPAAPVEAGLTRREREVLDLLAAGASNKVIARRLGLSFHTAKAHVAAVLQKLGAGSRADAVARGARAGLVLL